MSIWEQCQGINYCKPLKLEPWRMVEAQHLSSSRDLVDSIEEHELLELLLEKSKPLVDNKTHYLLFTPFRYPPLKYGSRFGNTFEPSLWYGSINLETALAEVAFYRLKFFDDTLANLEYIEIPMTAFRTFINANKGIDLSMPPFDGYQSQISNKLHYSDSQMLGAEMRYQGIEAFIYVSARDKKLGKNVGVFIPKVFQSKGQQYISTMQNWRCITNKNAIEFSRDEITGLKRREFCKNEFFIN